MIKINDRQKHLYEEKGYWGSETLVNYWDATVKKYGDHEFVVDDRGHRYTYKELDEKAAILASYFLQTGVKPSDIVTFQIPVWSEFVIITMACLKAGAVINPIGLCYMAEEVRYILNLCQSKVFICPTWYHKTNYEEMILSIKNDVESLNDIILLENPKKINNHITSLGEIFDKYSHLEENIEVNSNDIAVILFTSGTTDRSKGVMLTHNNIIFSERYFNKELEITKDDIIFMPSPLNHATGFHHGIISPMIAGGKVVLQERFNSNKAIDLMNREKCTYSMGATPFIYDILNDIESGYNSLETLRFYLCGGAPLPGHMVKKAYKYGINLCEVYGSTESVPHAFVRPEESLKLMGTTSGRAMEGVEIRIVDENRQDVVTGVIGEEVSRGPNVFVGYIGDKKTTNEALDDEGWFYSGDLCRKDEDGNIKIIGRKKDIIVRGGENLNINRICEYIATHPMIKDQAVIGIPDDRLGERICAYIVLKNKEKALELDDLLKYLEKNKISKRYWPERLKIIDEIPRNESGKVLKKILKEDYKKRMALTEEMLIQQKEFGYKRSREKTKPSVSGPRIEFYKCNYCNGIYQNISGNIKGQLTCCNKEMIPLKTKSTIDVLDKIILDYKILGGYNENVIKVFWKVKDENVSVEWIYLKTFRGGQIKHVTNIEKTDFIFALADEDSYVYCDEEVCLECTFRCKRGFEIYVYIKDIGMVKMPLERMYASW